MKRQFAVSLLAVSLLGLPVLVGCEKEVAKDETVKKNPDGSESKDSKVVTKDENTGKTTVTEEHKTTPPTKP